VESSRNEIVLVLREYLSIRSELILLARRVERAPFGRGFAFVLTRSIIEAAGSLNKGIADFKESCPNESWERISTEINFK